MSNLSLLLWLALPALAIIVVAIGVRFQRTTIYDYQRGLRYRDGRFTDLVEPGAHWTFGPTTGTPVPVRQVPSATEPVADSTGGGSASQLETE